MPNTSTAGPEGLEAPAPAFRLGKATSLCPVNGDRELQTYLARCVAGNRGDLLSHVRRILLGKSLNDADETFAALVNLFIATGDKGEAIKQRLLGICAPLLSPLQRQFLEKHRDTGLDAATAVSSAFTVLTSGAGRGKVVVPRS